MAFSFFFRDTPALETAAQTMIEQTQGQSRVRVWVAGCALGQEVYTLAILLAERMHYFAFQNLIIYASDIEKNFGDIVTRGEYEWGDIERIPDKLRDKYFAETGKAGVFAVNSILRSRVTFVHHDLLTLTPVCEEVSLIVCKNVLLHFQPEERVDVFRMFHRTLSRNGILANENTQKLPEEVKGLFHQISNDSQVYRKVEGGR